MYGIEKCMLGVDDQEPQNALMNHPDQFIPSGSGCPNRGKDVIRDMVWPKFLPENAARVVKID